MLKKILFVMTSVWLLLGTYSIAQDSSNSFWSNTQYWINVIWWTEWNVDDSLMRQLQSVLNYILVLLSFIALVILLYWWFQMVTAAWDEGKYWNWFKILKQAAIWLAIIWFSWLIVAMIFMILWAWATPTWWQVQGW